MTSRVHVSKKPLVRICSVRQQKEGAKPRGLWYGVDGGWIKWCKSEAPHWVTGVRRYNLELELRDVLILSGDQDLADFTDVYGVVGKHHCLRGDRRYADIDWAAVAREFGGIEIAPYLWKSRLAVSWYYTWDCASGCIWRAGTVHAFREEVRKNERRGRDARQRFTQ